jgi:hypothetical protein
VAITTWAALANNECVAHAEVENAVANSQLMWLAGNPGLVAGRVYARADFEAYLLHLDMSASGIASNELMSKSQMVTYRQLTQSWDAVSVVAPSVGSANVTITLDAGPGAGFTATVEIAYSHNNGAFGSYTDVTASLSPALGAPPTASTQYTYTTPYVAAAHDISNPLVKVRIRARIMNGANVIAEQTADTANWEHSV